MYRAPRACSFARKLCVKSLPRGEPRLSILKGCSSGKCGVVVIKAPFRGARAARKAQAPVVAAAADTWRERRVLYATCKCAALCTQQQSRELKWVRKWHGVEFALFAGVQNIELKLNGKDTKGNHMVGV